MDAHAKRTPGRKRLRSSDPGAGTSMASSHNRSWDSLSVSDTGVSPPTKRQAPKIRQESLLSSYSLGVGRIYHEWDAIYNRNALMARVVLKLTTNENDLCLQQSEAAIKNVKFFTRKSHQAEEVKISEFEVFSEPRRNPTAFEDHLKSSVENFPTRQDIPDSFYTLVENLKGVLLKSNLHYHLKKHGSCNMGWMLEHPEPDSPQSEEIQCLASTVRTAFMLDMRTGSAKQAFEELFLFLRDTMGLQQHYLRIWQPSLFHGTTTKVECLAEGDSVNYNRDLEIEKPIQTFFGQETASSEEVHALGVRPDLLPYPFVPAQRVVSDGLWSTVCLKNPKEEGKFILTVEIKPEHAHHEGVFQCYKQVISKLHCQPFLMGLVLSPMRYTYLMAYKLDGDMYIASYEQNLVRGGMAGHTHECQKRLFDVDSFGEMVIMLGRLLMYSKQLVERR